MGRVAATISGVFAGGGLLTAGAPLVLFGILAGYLFGLRDRLLLAAAAVPTSVGLLVITHQVLGSLGIGLRLWAVPLVALLPAAIFGYGRVRFARRSATSGGVFAAQPAAGWPVWTGVAAGCGLSLAAWLPGIGKGDLPAQANDDIWHGFLTARLAEMHTVTASAVAPVFTDTARPRSFYPYGLHLAAATLHDVTGASVPRALNAMWAVGIGLMIPFGVAALVRALWPERPWAAAYAAVASAAMPFFPYAVNGIQPYALGLSMVPVLLALLVGRTRGTVAGAGPVLVVGAVGLLLTHPAAAIVFLIAAVLVVLEVALRAGVANLIPAIVRLAPIALSAGVVSIPFLAGGGGIAAGLPSSATRPVASTAAAARMMLTLQTPWTPAHPVLALLIVIGLVACVVRKFPLGSLAISYFVFAALFVGAVTGASWSGSLLKPWYGEWYRLAGAASLFAPFLAGIAGDSLHLVGARLFARRHEGFRRAALVGVGLCAALFALGAARSVLGAQSTVSSAWQSRKLVTADDIALFRALAQRAGPGEQVLNNWQDGSTWMYAVAGVRPAVPYDASVQQDPRWSAVLTNVGNLAASPDSCRLLQDHHVTLAVAKMVMVGSGVNPFTTAASAQPGLFKVELAGPSGTIYRLDPNALQDCAGR